MTMFYYLERSRMITSAVLWWT